jgi:hypothetical protein
MNSILTIIIQEMFIPGPVTTPAPDDYEYCDYCLFGKKRKREIPEIFVNPDWEIIRNLNSTFKLPPPKQMLVL